MASSAHPKGCKCSVHGPSLFEMAAKRKAFKTACNLLEQAEQAKQTGNLDLLKGKALVKHTAGKTLLGDACQHYVQAIRHLNAVEDYMVSHSDVVDTDAESAGEDVIHERWKKLSVSIYLNLSLAGLLCEDFESGLRSAEKVLSFDSTNTKAMYRLAKCFIGQKKDDKALHCLEQALVVSPKSKDVRKTKKILLARMEKKRAKEAFEKETHDGLARLARKKQEMMKAKETNETAERSNAIAIVKEKEKERRRKEVEKDKRLATIRNQIETIHEIIARIQPTSCNFNNGGIGPCAQDGMQYVWGQSTEIVHVLLVVPKMLSGKNISVTIRRNSLTVMKKRTEQPEEDEIELLCIELSNASRVDDSTWMIEAPGLLHVELGKEQKEKWWTNVSPSHPSIDVALCDGGDLLMADVPQAQRATYDRAMYEEMQKSPEQRDQELEHVKMMDEWKEERRKDNVETMATTARNANKKELYEHLKTQFPDVNIQVKGN
jgi:tetratricopeptide (TPR) repeat protein